ncbi:MAG: sigma 54-interacting transcriptional regulator [Deltaproteobacteria bacterium]|nr:sigma 54-interacting transcriptional regulator [Deltaproteobacteria bacterium]MBW2075315.1 sigma 54-interacting transcriptional regulator [Deltaproteobacteria bacterium]RLB80637.1 MAG: Fis family transcriptional regulator [Deltaproteobacteria bacterium]
MERLKRSIIEHHQIILDSISDGVFTVDLGWRIMSFNKAAEQITGIPREEAIGQLCHEVFRANVCETGCVLRQTMMSGTPVRNMPVYIIRADEKRIPISVSTSLLKDEGGQVIGGVETFHDLTVIHELRKKIQKQQSFGDIISKSEKMLRLFSVLPQIAQSDSTVLIEGASGTGKELFARAIHNNGPRKKGPFVAVNCGALPDTLCESELFGYKAGAFTDAKKDKPGRFALAQNGTIFLDEIGDISQAVQVRLLRVLEQKVYEPLGATKALKTNARVIAATHRNMEEMVQQGRFREDLYYRINVVKLSLPPLSERKEDIPLLVDHFIERFNHLTGKHIVGLSKDAMAVLMLQNWPGNVRELENTIEHAFVLCQEELICLSHLPPHLVPETRSMLVPTGLTLKEVEKRTIQEALQRNQWKKVITARELGIDKNTLRRKIKRLGIIEPH